MARINNAFDILCEACEHECDEETLDDMMMDTISDEFEDEFEDIEEVDDEFFYSEEMVPVVSNKNYYMIEADMLGKYMESNNITEPDVAINNIAEHNDIDANNTVILVESSEFFKNMINEAKSCKGTSACNKKKVKLKSGIDLLKGLKNKGIKIVKKKSKPSKKKK